MSFLFRLLRSRLALRSAALTLLAVAIMGAASLVGAILVSEQRERAQQYLRLEELLDTVERTVQIACFLDNHDLANEVATGLLSNRIVGHVRISQADNVLVNAGLPETAMQTPIIRSVASPFMPEEEVCRIDLTPNSDQIRRSVLEASLFTAAILSIQLFGIGAAVVLVIIRLITRPITSVSRKLKELAAETGQKLEIPRGNEQDEVGKLVASVNGMIDRLVSALRGERQLRLLREVEERRYRTIFDNVETGIFELDKAGRLVSANPAFKRMFQLLPGFDPARDESWLRELAPGAQAQIDRMLQVEEPDSGPLHIEVCIDDGHHPRWFSLLLSRVEQGLLQGVANDVTERQLAAHAAQELAATDPLTGLGNRRGLTQRLQQAVSDLQSDPAQRYPLILLDLDKFKAANDSFGHAVGDQILQHVARLLVEVAGPSAYSARLGGDEFVVLVEGAATRVEIEGLARQFLDRVNQPILISTDTSVRIGASLGIAVLGSDAGSAEEVLRLADVAMYRAKRAGRNCFMFHQS